MKSSSIVLLSHQTSPISCFYSSILFRKFLIYLFKIDPEEEPPVDEVRPKRLPRIFVPLDRRLNFRMRSDLDYLWTGAELTTRSYMPRNHIRMPQPNLNTQAEAIQPSFTDLYKKLSYVFYHSHDIVPTFYILVLKINIYNFCVVTGRICVLFNTIGSYLSNYIIIHHDIVFMLFYHFKHPILSPNGFILSLSYN